MTLTELRYIVALAREQHFGRAARRCFVSQPTLSIGVKKLEDELGITIFERSKFAVHTTPSGKKIIAQAQKVLEETDALKEIASMGKDQLSSPLRVGAIYTSGPYLFPRMIPQLTRTAPAMPLYLEENFTSVLRQKLRMGELDVIIVTLPFTEPDVVTLPLYDEPFIVLMPGNHSLARQQAVDPVSLQAENVLMLSQGHCFRDQVLAACPALINRKDHTHPDHDHTSLEASSLETIRHMVASGMGITVLPISAADDRHYDSELLTTRSFKSSAPSRAVALAWRASFPRTKAIEILERAIRQSSIQPVKDQPVKG